jgi:amino acid transporter
MDIKRVLIGRPLANQEAPHQTIGKVVGLAVFASDALSSVAYATQEILVVLAGAAVLLGTAVFGISIPIAFAIVTLLVILTISYRQTIFAYPSGGGAYIVARDNLGELPAQIAGAALLTDYILTVSVSIASGTDQVASAIPALRPFQVELAVLAIVLMTVVNLRGVKESGRVFAIPTYFFITMMLITLGIGFVRFATGTLGQVEGVEMVEHTAQNLGIFLVLRAFSSGCAAVTGVEAISNGITAFREPRSRNAATTMAMMSAILGVMFIGITVLANRVHALPSETETIISQLGRVVFGDATLMYGLLIAATTVILIMAANTAFADFPRLCALHASDGFLPKQLTFRGSRLVFSWGIVVLAAASISLIVVFNASTTALIPLYAIGVFLSFTLSQAGMVVRWRRIGKLKPGEEVVVPNPHGEPSHLLHDRRWRTKQLVNAVGATMTFVVMCVFAVSKFADGAWITVILIPSLVFLFFRIHKHYKDVAHALSLSQRTVDPHPRNMLTIVMVDDVHAGTVQMVEFALSQGNPWMAIHLDDNPIKTARIKAKWVERMGRLNHELTIVPCPYRNLAGVAIDFVQQKLDEDPNRFVHVVMAQLIMDTWVAQALHANTAIAFTLALQNMERVALTNVGYQIHTPEGAPAQAPVVAAQSGAVASPGAVAAVGVAGSSGVTAAADVVASAGRPTSTDASPAGT